MSSDRRFKREEVHRLNNGEEKVLIIIHNNVYDVTSYLESHPGGRDVLLEQGGKDGTVEFDNVGHSLDARELMEQYKVGELDPDDHTGHKRPRCSFMHGLLILVPLGVAVIGVVLFKLLKRK